MRNLKYELKNGIWQSVLLEKHILKEIVERLWLEAKIKVYQIRERIPQKRNGWQQLSTAGIPDLIGWIPARSVIRRYLPTSPGICGCPLPLFIEVKRPKGVRREVQKQFIEDARAAGCIAFFAESWDDVVTNLQSLGIEVQNDTTGVRRANGISESNT